MMIAVSDKISSILIPTANSAELIIVELLSTTHLFLCCAYAPPNTSMLLIQDISSSLKIIPTDSHLVLVGDYNLPDLNWDTMSVPMLNGNILCDTLISVNLVQLIQNPTHMSGDILDLIISNLPDRICSLLSILTYVIINLTTSSYPSKFCVLILILNFHRHILSIITLNQSIRFIRSSYTAL